MHCSASSGCSSSSSNASWPASVEMYFTSERHLPSLLGFGKRIFGASSADQGIVLAAVCPKIHLMGPHHRKRVGESSSLGIAKVPAGYGQQLSSRIGLASTGSRKGTHHPSGDLEASSYDLACSRQLHRVTGRQTRHGAAVCAPVGASLKLLSLLDVGAWTTSSLNDRACWMQTSWQAAPK